MTATRFAPVRVGGFGLCSAFDMPPQDALRAIVAGKAAKRRHPVFVGADGLRQLCAPVESCLLERDMVKRTAHLAARAHAGLGRAGQQASYRVLLLPPLLGPASPLHDRTDQALAAGAFGARYDQVVFGGTSEATRILQTIADNLRGGNISDCVLVCADTLIAPFVLDVMAAQNKAPVRKSPYRPLPGELGAAVLLQAAARDSVQPGFVIEEVQTAQEPKAPDDAKRGLMGLESLAALRRIKDLPPQTRLIADSDGPRHKVEELGVLLGGELSIRDDHLIMPSAAIGAVGCASLPLFIGAALSVLADGAPSALIWLSGAAGARSLMRLDHHATGPAS